MPPTRNTNGQFTVANGPSIAIQGAQGGQGDNEPKWLGLVCGSLAAKICFALFVFVFAFGALKNSFVKTALSSLSLNNVAYSAGLVNSWICPEPEHDFCTKLNSLRAVIASVVVSMPEHAIKKYASSFKDAFDSFAPTCKFDTYRTTTASEIQPNGNSANLTKDAIANKTDSWWP